MIKRTIRCLMVVILAMVLMMGKVHSQHYEAFVSGIIILPQQQYSLANLHRNFTIQSSPSIIANTSLIFSPFSFNYFINEISCTFKQKKSTTITVTCSPNVYKLSYLLFQKGPNMFVVYSQRYYEQRDKVYDEVDVSEWMQKVKFPLQQLVKSDRSQYEITLHTFISKISVFYQTTMNNNESFSHNQLGSVKLAPIFYNITVDNKDIQKQLQAPLTVNIRKSININKIAFFSLIVINEMISLNYNFQTVSLGSHEKGQLSLGYFSGISEISFYLNININNYTNKTTINNNTYNNEINFNTEQNITTPTSTYNITTLDGMMQTFVLGKFGKDKIYNFTKGTSLNIKLNTLNDYFYMRCSIQGLTQYRRMNVFTEGKYYKLVPTLNTSLAMDIAQNGTIILSPSTTNSPTQQFFIHSLGTNRYRILNKLTQTPLMCNKSTQTYFMNYGWSLDQEQSKWRVIYSVVENVQPFLLMNLNGISMYLSTQNGNIRQGERLMLRRINSSVSNDTFRWVIQQIEQSQQSNGENNINSTNNNTTTKTALYETINNTLSRPTTLQSLQLNNSQNYRIRYYPQLNTFITQSYNKVIQSYNYFSLSQQHCYTQLQIDSFLGNKNNTQLQPYFVNFLSNNSNNFLSNNSNNFLSNNSNNFLSNNSNNNESIIDINNKNNMSLINISQIQFSNSHIYGIVMNRTNIQNYIKEITNYGYIRYSVNNNQYQLFVSNGDNNKNNINNSLDYNQNSKLVRLLNGCQRMKLVDNKLGYQCQQCMSRFVIYRPFIQQSINNQSIQQQLKPTKQQQQQPTKQRQQQPTKQQCYCPIGEYMTNNGQCRSCALHQYKCQPPINIQAQIVTNNDKQTSTSSQSQHTKSIQQIQFIQIKLYIYKSQQVQYKFMTSINQLLQNMNVLINNNKYTIPLDKINNCQNQYCENITYSFCINFTIINVTKSNYYSVKVAIKDDDDIQKSNQSNSSLNSYMLVKQIQKQPYINLSQPSFVSSAFINFVQPIIVNPLRRLLSYITTQNDIIPQPISSSSPSQSTTQYFFQLQTHQTIIRKPYTIQSIIQTIKPAIYSLNQSSSIILIAAPFLLDKFNLFSILQTNSILYMISFMKFPYVKNRQNVVTAVVRRMFIFRQQPIVTVFSLGNNDNNTMSQSDKGLIQLPFYSQQFQHNFLYNTSTYPQLSYPQSLYQSAIPSMDIYNNTMDINNTKQQQNYLTLTLNIVILIIIQILIMQLFIKLGIVICEGVQQIKKKDNHNNGQQIRIKNLVKYDIKRHRMVGGIDDDDNNNDNNNNYETLMSSRKKLSHKQNLTITNRSIEQLQLFTQKRIQWTPMPELKQCQLILNIQDQQQHKKKQQSRIKSQQQQQHNNIQQQEQQQINNNEQQEKLQYNQQISQKSTKNHNNKKSPQQSSSRIKQKILFFIYDLKQKRLIFYTSFIMIHIISQSYLLYFQLIKPFGYSSSSQQDDNETIVQLILSYVDLWFGLVLMFLIIIFPVFLINYYPLHLFKIVQVTCKFGGYIIGGNNRSQQIQQNDNNSNTSQQHQHKKTNNNNNINFIQHSYTYGQIYFHFCIIYYEIILIPFSVALGTNLFCQSLPILLYQLFKLIWLYKKLKVLDKLKIIAMCVVFSFISIWDFLPYNKGTQQIFQDFVIYSLYCVLFIQAAKLVKFIVVFIVGLLKTKRKQHKNKQNNKKTKSTKKLISKTQFTTTNKSLKLNKQISIVGLQQQNSPSHSQYNTQKIILDKKKHNQRPKTIKFKQSKLQMIKNKQQLYVVGEQKEKEQRVVNQNDIVGQQRQTSYNNNNNDGQGQKFNRRKIRQYKTDFTTTKKIQQQQQQQKQQSIIFNQPKQSLSTQFKFTRKRQKTVK